MGKGRILIWDATCIDTYAASYVDMAAKEVGSVASLAETRKKSKYQTLPTTHCFTPVAIVTSGVFGPETKQFLSTLSSKIKANTLEDTAYNHLVQQLSITIQRGNAMSIHATMK